MTFVMEGDDQMIWVTLILMIFAMVSTFRFSHMARKAKTLGDIEKAETAGRMATGILTIYTIAVLVTIVSLFT